MTKTVTQPPAPNLSGLEAKLWEVHDEEHSKLGMMLADKQKTQIETNWQGGKVNGLATAIEIVRVAHDAIPLASNVTSERQLGFYWVKTGSEGWEPFQWTAIGWTTSHAPSYWEEDEMIGEIGPFIPYPPPAQTLRGPTLAETDATNAEAGAAAISAILDGTPGQGVEVKPLEWSEAPNDDGPMWRWKAGDYGVTKMEWGSFSTFDVSRGHWLAAGPFATLEAAKAAAQADYERRILSALSTPTPKEESK